MNDNPCTIKKMNDNPPQKKRSKWAIDSVGHVQLFHLFSFRSRLNSQRSIASTKIIVSQKLLFSHDN